MWSHFDSVKPALKMGVKNFKDPFFSQGKDVNYSINFRTILELTETGTGVIQKMRQSGRVWILSKK